MVQNSVVSKFATTEADEKSIVQSLHIANSDMLVKIYFLDVTKSSFVI